MTQGTADITRCRNKSTSAGRVARKGRTGCLFPFFFYSSELCCASILHFKPTSYGGLRRFKSGIYLGCTLLGVESTSEIKPSPTAASLVYSLRCKAASNAQPRPAARKHIQRSEEEEGEEEKKTPPAHFSFQTNNRVQISGCCATDTYI